MLSISQKKKVTSLKQKKFRTTFNSFIIEGVKMVEELLLSDYEVEEIYATADWAQDNSEIDCIEVSEKELGQISSLKTPNKVLAVVQQKEAVITGFSTKLTLALDKLQDPGNMGTIIRTSDWFGIDTIVCSEDSVDVYNPKVIQATMGSFFRVSVVYVNLSEFFTSNEDLTVYGGLLDGDNVYQKN